jgi:hypothetical protein
MQDNFRSTWRIASIACAGLLFLFVALSLSLSTPALAQSAPTATPTDPIWRGFSAARDAIEEEKSVDLTLIREYTFEQAEFQPGGIDSCVPLDDPNSAREVYFGWIFNITDLRGTLYQARVSFDLKAVAICDPPVNAGVAPAPAGTPNPNLPTPIPGSAVSGSFELGGHVLDLSANTVSLMNRAGMKWVKKQIRYSVGQDPSSVAGTINAAKASGFKILIGIVGEQSQMGDFAGYINSYSQFVAGVAALGADAIEVWNEPNIDREWPAASINGANYTQLLAAAYNAIKAANANTIVVSGAPAPTGFFGTAGCGSGGCNDDTFMAQMAAAGAAQYMDCVGLHYNEGIVSPSTNSGDPRGEYPSYYFSSMLARGYNPFGGKQVCFSELGYLSGQGFNTAIPASFGWAANTTVAQHAAWLAEAATSAAQSGKVRLMIVWNVDFPFYTATDPMGGYAIFRPDGTCPACDTLGAVMRR